MWQASTHTHEYHEDHGLKVMSHVMSTHSSGPGDCVTGVSNAVQRTMHKRPQVSAVHFSLALRDSVEQQERAGNRKVTAAVWGPGSRAGLRAQRRRRRRAAPTGVGELQVPHSSSMSMASREVPPLNLA